MIISVLVSLVVVAVTACGAWSTARLLFGRVWSFPHPALRVATLACLGLLLWSHFIFGLTCAHVARRAVFLGLLAILGALTAIEIVRASRATSVRTAIRSCRKGRWLVLLPVALYFGWLAAAATLPPTATDELVYHLEVPKTILEVGRLPFFRDNVYAYCPQFGEMLYLFGIAVGGEIAAKLFHVLFAALLGLAVFGFSRQVLDRSYSALACVLFLSVPSVVLISSWAYVDLMFSAFTFLALVALLDFFESERKASLVLAAVLAGGACSVKYTGLQYLLLLLLLLLIYQLRARLRTGPVVTVVFPVLAIGIASPYYLRNLVFTGWPLFPFELPLFTLSSEISWDSYRAALFLRFLTDYGAAFTDTLAGRLLGPVLVFVKARFSDPHAYDGFVGPVFLLIPALWWRIQSPPANLRRLAWFSVFFFVYWTMTSQQVRFLIPVLPGMAVLLAFALKAWGSRSLAGVAWLLAAAGFVVGLNQTLKLDPLPYWIGTESREAYLSRIVPAYDAYQQADKIVGQHGKVFMVCSSNLLYYFNSPVRSDYVFEAYEFAKAVSQANCANDIQAFLRSQSATHLFMNEFILTHPKAGLPPNDLEKLREFLSSSARELYHKNGFRLFELTALNHIG
ncbi:MAG TPA: DUF1420 family protein [Acidobacteriota bacterium]|nr:DUF1420 family protein [Acidobacteriota bacterium]